MSQNTYKYPKITGYKWNAKQKISIALGIAIGDFVLVDDATTTNIIIKKLSQKEKQTLDRIMANGPCGVPNPQGTAIKIKDLWSMRDWFRDEIGLEFTFWFEEETDGRKECYIHLHFPKKLTAKEKNKIMNVYRKMIK
jgi:hypothetical protein